MITLIVLIIDLYRYSPQSIKYLKNVSTSVFFEKNNLIFKRQFGFNHIIVNFVED